MSHMLKQRDEIMIRFNLIGPTKLRTCLKTRQRKPAGHIQGHRVSDLSLNCFSAGFTGRGVLVTGPTAAADCADQLSTLNKRITARTCDQRRVEGPHIWMTSFISIIEQPAFASKTSGSAGFTLSDGY